MLIIERLTRRFGDRIAVDNVSLAIERGSFAGIIGRSGAGKSTLLRMINRMLPPSEGRILYNGVSVTSLKGQALLDWRMKCAMIFQQFNLIGRADVFTNVMMGRINHMPAWRSMIKLWPERDRAIVLSAMDQFDIGPLAAQQADTLSGGQQQRVAIARALVQEPEILLADEPIASLDPHSTKIVMDALLHINRQFGITVICNLHSLDLAKQYCQRLIGLANGKVAFDGPADSLTAPIIRELYGFEAAEAVGVAPTEPHSLNSGDRSAVTSC